MYIYISAKSKRLLPNSPLTLPFEGHVRLSWATTISYIVDYGICQPPKG